MGAARGIYRLTQETQTHQGRSEMGQGGRWEAGIRKFLERCTGNMSLKKERKVHFHLMNPKAQISYRDWVPPQAPLALSMGGTVCFPVSPRETRGALRTRMFPCCCPPLPHAWHLLSAQIGQTDPLTTGSTPEILTGPLVCALN